MIKYIIILIYSETLILCTQNLSNFFTFYIDPKTHIFEFQALNLLFSSNNVFSQSLQKGKKTEFHCIPIILHIDYLQIRIEIMTNSIWFNKNTYIRKYLIKKNRKHGNPISGPKTTKKGQKYKPSRKQNRYPDSPLRRTLIYKIHNIKAGSSQSGKRLTEIQSSFKDTRRLVCPYDAIVYPH